MISLITQHPVATDSPDHLHPVGTKADNSRNRRFNQKLYTFVGTRVVRVIDIGCSGGGFVKDCLDDGHIAVGLEGSDYSLKEQRAEWATIPGNLFTCDVRQPFSLFEGNRCFVADVVTAWEFLEHIEEDRLAGVADNVRRHLSRGGVWIASIATFEAENHVTVKPREWWLKTLGGLGFVNDDAAVRYFGSDWIRDQGENGFHVVLRRS